MTESTIPVSEGEPTLRGDAAKQSIEEDEFGLKTMVAGLAETLTKRVAADGYILGIEGRWGSGKSTFVNFIAEEIKRTPGQYIIRFEPWLIGEKNALLSSFLGQLAFKIDEIKNEDRGWWHPGRWRVRRLKSRLANRIRKYGEYIGVLATPVGGLAAADSSGALALSAVGLKTIGTITKLFGRGAPSLEQLKSQITSELRKLEIERPGIRFTVIMDDTDRLEPVEAVELLRLVRKVADFPITTYVVCFDMDVLSKQVLHALNVEDGHLFIEKTFQDIVHLPPQEPFALRRNLRMKLEQTFTHEMGCQDAADLDRDYRKHLIFDRWGGEFIKTPRDVVRLHEAVSFAWPKVPKGADFFDFVWLQLIKQKAPQLYLWTQSYLQNVGAYRDGGRAGDEEPRKEAEKLQKIMEAFHWAGRAHISGIGTFLPGVSEFVLGGDNRKVFQFDDGELARFERAKRLGSPSHWRQYFAFDMPSYAIKDEEIVLFRQASKDDSNRAAAVLRNLFEKPHERPGHFVDLLLDRLCDLPPDSFARDEIRGIASVFAAIMDEVAVKSADFTSAGESAIWRKAMQLLYQSDAGDFHEIVKNGKSINWLALVVRYQGFAHGRPRGHRAYPESQWLTMAQLDAAILIITHRFQNVGLSAIFHLPSPLEILFCWHQLGEADDVRKRFAAAIRSDEAFLDAMNALRGWANSSDIGIHHPLHKRYVEYFVDAEEARTRLLRLAHEGDENNSRRDLAKELLSEWDSDSAN